MTQADSMSRKEEGKGLASIQSISTMTGGNKKTSENYTNYTIGQNTEKCPGDLGRFAITQTTMYKHQLTLV